MKEKIEVENKIQPYLKERLLMNVPQFDQLLKRVNLEENIDVKKQILTIIEKYIDVIGADHTVSVTNEVVNVETPVSTIEEVEEAVVPTEVIEETAPAEEIKEENVQGPVVSEIVVQQKETIETPIDDFELNQHNAAVKYAEMAEEEHQTVMTEIAEEAIAREEAVEEVVPEEIAPEVEEEPVVVETVATEVPVQTNDQTEYIEEFGLISTTNEEAHLAKIIERGGVLFREKRSFTLMLCLDDELVAVAKTIKLEQFPEEVQEHMKKGGFVSCNVVSFGEITKRSRARYTNVTYKNLQVLEDDHWIVQNVTNLLEKGEVPEHAKKDEPIVVEPKQEEVVAVADEKPYLISTFMIPHPALLAPFQNQREAVLSQVYGISSIDGVAKFFTRGADGVPVIIGIDEKTPLKPNHYSAKIMDYTLKEIDGKPYIQFKLDADIIEATVQPAPVSEPVVEATNEPVVAPQTQKADVGLKTIGEVPADFPATNKLDIVLHPLAESMFSMDQAKKMIGQALSLGMITHPEDNVARISLMHDVFEMGTTANTLTAEPMRNSKWVARLTNVALITDESTQRKSLVVQFDSLLELEAYPHEAKTEVLDVLSYVPITEESYAARQRDIAIKRESAAAATTQPVVAPTTAEEVGQETVSAEALLNKEVTPQGAQQLLNPNPTADYSKGYQELVSSQSKDMGGAVQELRDKTALTQQNRAELLEQAQGVISGVITQTLKDTNIHTKTEEKQTTTVVGNLQDGAGNLSQTDTVINFATGFTPQSWAQSVGKQVNLLSEMNFSGGPVTTKTVSLVGKNGVIVGQGQVQMTEALLLDGNQHTATLIAIENAVQEQQGFVVSLRLGNFNKVA